MLGLCDASAFLSSARPALVLVLVLLAGPGNALGESAPGMGCFPLKAPLRSFSRSLSPLRGLQGRRDQVATRTGVETVGESFHTGGEGPRCQCVQLEKACDHPLESDRRTIKAHSGKAGVTATTIGAAYFSTGVLL